MTKVSTSPENSAESLAVRAAMRRERLAARVALARSTELHASMSAAIRQSLSKWFAQQSPASFGFCAPIRGEFDCIPLATQLISEGWQAAVAVSEHAAAPLMFRQWTPQSVMAADRHGIPVPQTEFVDAPAVLLIPLVAYDKFGFRLGYGGGYFDRTLAKYTTSGIKRVAIGVGFSLAEVETVLPHRHDQPMDLIVTESGIQTPIRSATSTSTRQS